MKLILDAQREQLIANGRNAREGETQGDNVSPMPVVKLFTPDAQATWLLTELDPDDEDRAFGLCDLGLGSPELGYVSIAEIEALSGPLGLPVERDRYFAPDKSLTRYADDARACGHIKA
jgi:hypothetical protein